VILDNIKVIIQLFKVNDVEIEVFGEVPLARFGHTITQGNFISMLIFNSIKVKIILFGGATGDTGKYIITGDTYAFDLISYKWTKLEGN